MERFRLAAFLSFAPLLLSVVSSAGMATACGQSPSVRSLLLLSYVQAKVDGVHGYWTGSAALVCCHQFSPLLSAL